MSWKEKMKEFGGCEVAFLTEDGEVAQFVVCGEPELFEGKFKGQATKRIAFPIVATDGMTILVLGMRAARRLSKYEKTFDDTAFEVIRHGEPGDQDATYAVKPIDDDDLTIELFEIKAREFNPDVVGDMMSGVNDMIRG